MQCLSGMRFLSIHHHLAVFGAIALCISPIRVSAGSISSSLEQYNYQIGHSMLTVRSYDAFDQLDDLPGVTGLTVQVNGGPLENVAFNDSYNAYKRRQSWNSVAEMVAARPENASIVHTLQGSPAGVVSINAPGISYQDAVPISPLFEIDGVNGYWTENSDGAGVFNFDANSIDSFTIHLNAYAANTPGSHFFYGISVEDNSDGSDFGDRVHSGLLQTGAPSPSFSLIFTRGLPLDGGDADPTTFGFDSDSLFELEGEFGNIFGLTDAGLGDGSQKAFVYQNNTSLILHASPVPIPAGALLLGSALAGLGGVYRHSRLRGSNLG